MKHSATDEEVRQIHIEMLKKAITRAEQETGKEMTKVRRIVKNLENLKRFK